MKRIVIVSDLQVPFHDRHAVKNLASFISKFKPHEVVTIGDEIDFNTISKWSEGTPEAYEQTLGDGCIGGLCDWTESSVLLGDHKVLEQPHRDRLQESVRMLLACLLTIWRWC